MAIGINGLGRIGRLAFRAALGGVLPDTPTRGRATHTAPGSAEERRLRPARPRDTRAPRRRLSPVWGRGGLRTGGHRALEAYSLPVARSRGCGAATS